MNDRSSTSAPERRYAVVSSDSHVGAKTLEDYVPYADAVFRDRLRSLSGANGELQLPGMLGPRDPHVEDPDPVRRDLVRLMLRWGMPEAEVRERAQHFSVDTVEGGGDFAHRLEVTEQQGVAAEVYTPLPMLDGVVPPTSPFLAARWGTAPDVPFLRGMKQAYNRWLADLCNAAPGRRAGIIQVDFTDMEDALQQIREGRNAGLFGGVSLLPADGAFALPSYVEPYWEPLWCLLEDLDIPAYVHGGGEPPDAPTAFGSDPAIAWELHGFEFWIYARRLFWLMMFGGVFDRHPNVKLVIGENNAGWVPGMLQELEAQFDVFYHLPAARMLKQRPTEYFVQNCFVAASLLSRQEVESRHEIGIDNLCWGSDYPHPEGAVPFVREVIQHQVGGLPPDEIERILGMNAMRVWDFDKAAVMEAAGRIGATESDLRAPLAREAVPPAFSVALVSRHVSIDPRRLVRP